MAVEDENVLPDSYDGDDGVGMVVLESHWYDSITWHLWYKRKCRREGLDVD